MKISSLSYSFRDAFLSMKRNKLMTLASLATVAITLIILGCAWLLVLNTNYLASTMESELEISVYVHTDLSREEALNMRTDIEALSGIASVTFVPKEEGLQSMEGKFGEDVDLLETLRGRNPLPDMYRIKATDADQVPALALAMQSIQGVEQVKYGQGMVEKLLSLTDWIRSVGLIVIIAVSIAAIFLIATSIRLTVFARRKEIGIMKMVGATNAYIRWPFFLEGMIIGLSGAVIAVGVIHFFYMQLSQNVSLTLSFISIMNDKTVIMEIYRNLLFLGTFIGAMGSAISLRRFLKV